MAFDPRRISYDRLLAEFWDAHDPTEPAWSRQYRSAIFVHDERSEAGASGQGSRGGEQWLAKSATAIEPADVFTQAEDYHQKYELRHVGAAWRELVAAYPSIDDLVRSTAAARMNAWVAGYGTEADLHQQYVLDEGPIAHDAGEEAADEMGLPLRCTCHRRNGNATWRLQQLPSTALHARTGTSR